MQDHISPKTGIPEGTPVELPIDGSIVPEGRKAIDTQHWSPEFNVLFGEFYRDCAIAADRTFDRWGLEGWTAGDVIGHGAMVGAKALMENEGEDRTERIAIAIRTAIKAMKEMLIDEIRHRSRRRKPEWRQKRDLEYPSTTEPEDPFAQEDMRKELRVRIEQLKGPERAYAEAAWAEGEACSIKTIAQRMGRSTKQVYRIRQRLWTKASKTGTAGSVRPPRRRPTRPPAA